MVFALIALVVVIRLPLAKRVQHVRGQDAGQTVLAKVQVIARSDQLDDGYVHGVSDAFVPEQF